MVDRTHPEIGSTGPAKKEWRRPELRRLPIAATAGSGKAIVSGNDGVGRGQGRRVDIDLLNAHPINRISSPTLEALGAQPDAFVAVVRRTPASAARNSSAIVGV